MRNSNSLLQDLSKVLPKLRTQVYFKASLSALSHAMEDLVLASNDRPLVIANFQQARFYRQETRRYQRIAQRTSQIYVLATPDSVFSTEHTPYETIALNEEDELAQEWNLVIIGQHYAACLVCREYAAPIHAESLDQYRQFQGVWSFDRQVSLQAAHHLLGYIQDYRPDLAQKIAQNRQSYPFDSAAAEVALSDSFMPLNVKLFSERLMTYLQASQYKLLKAYRTIAVQAQRQQLINSICAGMRRSLDPEQILDVMVQELGQIFHDCRCLLYRCEADRTAQPIEYEALPQHLQSLKGQMEVLSSYPLFQIALSECQTIAIADILQDLSLKTHPDLRARLQTWQIGACLVVPICYQNNWLGVLELHHPHPRLWVSEDVTLVEAIATQAGVALMQAQAYTNLEDLNHQLMDLERNQRNLIAIVGHELRTPLSTVQVCLESLSTLPDMPLDMQQSMLDAALSDTERLRKLIQDFLTLSRLESGLTRWQMEPISLDECLGLVISSFEGARSTEKLPKIDVYLPQDLPPIQSDGDGVIDVLTKLLDNACKFTPADGKVTIRAQIVDPLRHSQKSLQKLPEKTEQVEIVIADTGRGIEPNQLEHIFERFYQEEGFLQRTVGGTGLGLAISRRIVQRLGGDIWALSSGKNQGSEFHFTLPISVVLPEC